MSIRCISSSPSAPHKPSDALPDDAVTEDAFAAFCVLAAPVEPEIRHLYERAVSARTLAEMHASWREIDAWREAQRRG